MSFHPAYPSSADLRLEANAEEPDVADLVALRDLRRIVADAIAKAGRFDGIRHPDRRWTTGDLLEVLQGELANIDDTAAMIRRGPLVLEEAGVMRVQVNRQDYAPDGCHWYATEHGMDLDVAIGTGRTPLAAIADLFWALDIEDVDPARCDIVWETAR